MSEKEKLLNMESIIEKRVVGQQRAVEAVSNCVRISRAGLHSHSKPMGTFLFLGPSGVGKTELSKVCTVLYAISSFRETLRFLTDMKLKIPVKGD